MKLWSLETCGICGEAAYPMAAVIISDAVLCESCASALSCFVADWGGKSLADVQDHLCRRSANQRQFTAFQPSRTAGPGDCLMVDDDRETFVLAFGRDFADGNPQVFDFYQLLDVRLVSTVEGIAANKCGFDLTFRVNDPYLESLTYKVRGSAETIVDQLQACPSAIEAAMQIMGKLDLPGCEDLVFPISHDEAG